MPTDIDKLLEEGEDFVLIDELHLDKECLRQATNYLKIANLVADLRCDVDEAKAELEVVEAEISKEVRESPALFGLEKITVDAVKSVVIINKRFKAAQKSLLDAKHNQDLAQAILSAMDQKKRTLTLLVELHGQGYFADPKVSPKGKEVLDRQTMKEVNRHQRKRARKEEDFDDED